MLGQGALSSEFAPSLKGHMTFFGDTAAGRQSLALGNAMAQKLLWDERNKQVWPDPAEEKWR